MRNLMLGVLDHKNIKELLINVSVNGISDKSLIDFEKQTEKEKYCMPQLLKLQLDMSMNNI